MEMLEMTTAISERIPLMSLSAKGTQKKNKWTVRKGQEELSKLLKHKTQEKIEKHKIEHPRTIKQHQKVLPMWNQSLRMKT